MELSSCNLFPLENLCFGFLCTSSNFNSVQFFKPESSVTEESNLQFCQHNSHCTEIVFRQIDPQGRRLHLTSGEFFSIQLELYCVTQNSHSLCATYTKSIRSCQDDIAIDFLPIMEIE